MTFTAVLSTDTGKTRLLIPDRVEASAVFQDDAIEAFLAIEDGIKRAAALALETIAADTVMVLRVTETLGLKVDGAKASDAILKRAALLRKQADDADAALDVDGMFDIAEWGVDPFSIREIQHNDLLRSGV